MSELTNAAILAMGNVLSQSIKAKTDVAKAELEAELLELNRQYGVKNATVEVDGIQVGTRYIKAGTTEDAIFIEDMDKAMPVLFELGLVEPKRGWNKYFAILPDGGVVNTITGEFAEGFAVEKVETPPKAVVSINKKKAAEYCRQNFIDDPIFALLEGEQDA